MQALERGLRVRSLLSVGRELEITGMLPGSGDNRAAIRAVTDSIKLLGSRDR